MRSARREVRLLEEAGFSLRALKSTLYLPLLRRKLKKLRSWSGYTASRFGSHTIFVAVKQCQPDVVRNAVRTSTPIYSPAPSKP